MPLHMPMHMSRHAHAHVHAYVCAALVSLQGPVTHSFEAKAEAPLLCRGRQLALDVVKGIMHMHCLNFAHQDLKSKNILISRDWTAKVADMGLFGTPVPTGTGAGTKAAGGRRSSIRGQQSAAVGTLEWTSPEVGPHVTLA